jgi:hypothetical protein
MEADHHEKGICHEQSRKEACIIGSKAWQNGGSSGFNPVVQIPDGRGLYNLSGQVKNLYEITF